MKKRRTYAIMLAALLLLSGCGAKQQVVDTAPAEAPAAMHTTEPQLDPADQDSRCVAELIEILGGGDGLYKNGLNGMDMYEHLGYVYMGWRTTGGTWQNQVICSYIMEQLAAAGYRITGEAVTAPYGTASRSDQSNAPDGDYAWVTQYQGTEDMDLGEVWDPEYSSLRVYLTDVSGTPAEDPDAAALSSLVSGEQWGFDPCTEVYQKAFAKAFHMDYEAEIAPLPDTDAKVKAMHAVLMSSDVEKDERTGVDDFRYIAREEIGHPNLEAELNQRARLAWNSCFTAPAGTAPEDAAPLCGELVYVGAVDPWDIVNSEGIASEHLAGKVIITDSDMRVGFYYAQAVGAVGVASKSAIKGFLCPRDSDGSILRPWNTSSRYAEGADLSETAAAAADGKPIVEWQLSNEQYDSLLALLKLAEENNSAADETERVRVMCEQIAIGQTYPMSASGSTAGKGQAIAVAEIKGSIHPEKRVLICAHVQEPGCNDNATGVAAMLGMATRYKEMVDAGTLPRPNCTITFLWGDEMNLASFWLDAHPAEAEDLIGALDMDMTGEDPKKTGGVMRIEKTPDPSAEYGYTLDAVPWDEPDEWIPSLANPYYDENYKSIWDDGFVRLPDSHTLWGAGDTQGLFSRGWYLNDLYRYVSEHVIARHDPDFRLEVCPYEGGSDHSVFLAYGIPALLTWHFTDYSYHSTSDTLYMASPRELESVGITTLATALVMDRLCNDDALALEVLHAIENAALERMETEKTNADHHRIYADAGYASLADAYADETEVLNAWGTWYGEALESVAQQMDAPSEALTDAIRTGKAEVAKATSDAISHAAFVLDENS